MKKYKDGLFRIGEVTKILGVTRKALLVYEDIGLLTPAVKDKESGFQYYSADNMTQISSIRGLQTLGLSLKEVSEYYSDAKNMDLHLQRLLELRGTLDNNIQMLQVRSAKQDDLTVHRTFLPQQVCFCRKYLYGTVAEASNHLRDTYIAAARTGMMSRSGKIFTMRMTQGPDVLEFECCIPMSDDFDGPERMEFAATDALCIYYRAPTRGPERRSGRWRSMCGSTISRQRDRSAPSIWRVRPTGEKTAWIILHRSLYPSRVCLDGGQTSK